MTRIAILDDWQGIAEAAADWSGVRAKADIVFFRDAFASADATIAALRDFDAVLAMRERTRLRHHRLQHHRHPIVARHRRTGARADAGVVPPSDCR